MQRKRSGQYKNTFLRLFATLISLVMAGLGTAYAANKDVSANNGNISVHYPTNKGPQCDAVVLGVGTAMGVNGYDKLSSQLVANGFVVVIMDHAVGNMVKTDKTKYRNLALEVKSNLLGWISDSQCTSISHWMMGGHSAGGQAAHNALVDDSTLADAVFSIDPYDISGSGQVNLPALYWGFDVTTCFVEKDKAAKAAYYRSTSQRAFYKVAKQYSWGPCGYSPKYFHCSFCDGHCPACTNCSTTPDSFFVDVAASVKRFANASFYGSWSKATVNGASTTPVTLYVDAELP